jgi:hypothetical protein
MGKMRKKRVRCEKESPVGLPSMRDLERLEEDGELPSAAGGSNLDDGATPVVLRNILEQVCSRLTLSITF